MRFKSDFWIYLCVFAGILFLNLPHRSVFFKHLYLSSTLPAMNVLAHWRSKLLGGIPRSHVENDLLSERDELKKKINDLELYLVHLGELEDENERLRELLDFKKSTNYETLAAQVVGRSYDRYRKSIIINKGVKAGVKEDMPVVTRLGIVGVVSEVGQKYSQVLLLIDPTFKVSGLLQSSRQEGIVKGTGGKLCEMEYLSREAAVDLQEVIVSSGLGGIFPKGLAVGGVQKIVDHPNHFFKTLSIQPAVDFSTLEEVLVLTGPRRGNKS